MTLNKGTTRLLAQAKKLEDKADRLMDALATDNTVRDALVAECNRLSLENDKLRTLGRALLDRLGELVTDCGEEQHTHEPGKHPTCCFALGGEKREREALAAELERQEKERDPRIAYSQTHPVADWHCKRCGHLDHHAMAVAPNLGACGCGCHGQGDSFTVEPEDVPAIYRTK